MKLMFWVGALLAVPLLPETLKAEDTNTLQIIQQLQRRIGELEQKVKTLEGKQSLPGSSAPDAQAQQRMEELDQKVKILERNRELEEEELAAQAKAAPKITIGERGFAFASANTNFALQLKGVLQVDSRTFLEDGGIVGNDSLLLRRARPVLSGTVFRDFDFLFVPDFAGSSPQ
ncbi:MAG TPA: ABC transporter C-terminal domain-containing protein, partial [Candidatus Sulfotelmatobacter sp.]|nr:ABC transporter C-terminal domain-containing protein [Candidatus Sulfotelmatobacter sp.]